MTAYDDWKLSGPLEAEEEWIEATCDHEDDEGNICTFDNRVTAQISGDRLTWDCPTCDWEHEESAQDRRDCEQRVLDAVQAAVHAVTPDLTVSGPIMIRRADILAAIEAIREGGKR